MLLGLAALLPLLAPDSVAFPLDYYSANEMTGILSGHGVKYVADPSLNPDLYLISLPAAPVSHQLELLCEGLGLQAEETGATRKVGPDREVSRQRDRLRDQVVSHLIDQWTAQTSLLASLASGEPLPQFPKADPISIQALRNRAASLRASAASQPLARLLQEAESPSADELEDSRDTTAVYPRTALSPDLAQAIDHIIDPPPLRRLIFGYQIHLYSRGPEIDARVVPVSNGRLLLALNAPSLNLPSPGNRKSVVDIYLKGQDPDPVYANPGLKPPDKDRLYAREAETERTLAALDSSLTSKLPIQSDCFSPNLAALANAADLPLIYEVNSHDERPPALLAPIGFKQLFGKGCGYTATIKDGVLLVRDELNILPSFESVPDVALLETLHAKYPGKSMHDIENETPRLFVQDLDRFVARSQLIENFIAWPRNVSVPFPIDDRGWAANASPVVLPVLHQLTQEDFKRLISGEVVSLDGFEDPDLVTSFARVMYNSPLGFSRAEADFLFDNSRLGKVVCTMYKLDEAYQLKVNIEIKNALLAAPLGVTAFLDIYPDDPFVKQMLGP